jgi:hypothetical protein
MSWADLTGAAERIRANAVAADPRLADLPLAGIGWATVESERAMRELDALLAGDEAAANPGSWEVLDRDAILGSRVWRRLAAGPPARPVVVVLEPDTEGRLAASLARFGEGVAVIYLGDGPVRAGRVVGGGKPWGPHVVLL